MRITTDTREGHEVVAHIGSGLLTLCELRLPTDAPATVAVVCTKCLRRAAEHGRRESLLDRLLRRIDATPTRFVHRRFGGKTYYAKPKHDRGSTL